jgi:hypothetical protein
MKLSHSGLRTVAVALLFLLLGSLTLVAGANASQLWLSTLLSNIGAFVIASVAMALIFEFWQLRGLLNDLFAAAKVSEQLQRAQLSGFSVSFYDNIPWDELFRESNRLDLMIAYGTTWRNTHLTRLRRFLERKDAKLKIVLPDPVSHSTVDELARRFSFNHDEMRRRIEEAFEFFKALGENAGGEVEIYYCIKAPLFTFYRFNNRVVFATYRHRLGRGPILTLVGNRGGEFYEWVRDEWYGITRDGVNAGITRRVYPLHKAAKPT